MAKTNKTILGNTLKMKDIVQEYPHNLLSTLFIAAPLLVGDHLLGILSLSHYKAVLY